MDLTTKTAIVSGASKGLGRATAKALVQKGCKVFGLARNKGGLDSLQKELGKSFVAVPLDITDAFAVEKWISDTFSTENAPDILINNAGAGVFGAIDELPLEKWEQMIGTNLSGMFYLTRGVASLMKEQQSPSHIINIGSILGKTTNATKSAYSATKYALQGFSESLFKELRPFNIKVTVVNPGSIETDFFAQSGIKANSAMLHPQEIAATLIHVLETPDNVLIDELTLRPLNPK